MKIEKDNRVYREEDKAITRKLGKVTCPVCGKLGAHIEKRGKGFYVRSCKCMKCNSINSLKKVVLNSFKIGDRIRYYEKLSFGKNAKIDFDSYIEGMIIKKEKFIIEYFLDIRVERKVYKNRDVLIDDDVCIGISSVSNLVETLPLKINSMII